MKILPEDFSYVDLFAGIGGFHCAMDAYSDKKAVCRFASEIDADAQKTYHLNFPNTPLAGDIKKIDPVNYKPFDVVCGGFPCQTFSKAGHQAGFADPRGTLFREILRLIEYYPSNKRPKVLILENVRNLISHDKGITWKTIRKEIQDRGYNIVERPLIVAPKDVGVPQLRDRAIILAVRRDIYDGPIDLKIGRNRPNTLSIDSIVESDLKPKIAKKYALTPHQNYELKCWDDFIHHINRRIIGFPIWSDVFGKRVRGFKEMPDWKQDFIRKNQLLYEDNKDFIDDWLLKWGVRESFTPTARKFEWQVNNKISSVFQGIIQFRTSGIRVKQPTESPALVAMVHLPVLGSKKRFVTPREAARLQSFPEEYNFHERDFLIYKQLGNAVNVKVIQTVFESFIDFLEEKTKGE